MTLDCPDDFDASARDRIALTLAEAELGRYEPISFVVFVFEVFIDELIFAANKGAGRTAATVQRDSTVFLDHLIKSVYAEYPQSVRLPDTIGPAGNRLQQWSFVNWHDLRGFKSEVYDTIRKTQSWKDVQQCIVDLAETAATTGVAGGTATHVMDQPPSLQSATGVTPSALLEGYRAVFPEVKIAWICRATNVHSPDFYRWRQGQVSPQSPLAGRLERFLKAMQAPPERARRPKPKP